MNLIHQFPDVSMKMRDKFKLRKKAYLWKDVNTQLTYDKGMTRFYDNEFRKWHFKLIFIIVLGIASLYFIILNAPGFFQWVIK